jgi:hypothetical protein
MKYHTTLYPLCSHLASPLCHMINALAALRQEAVWWLGGGVVSQQGCNPLAHCQSGGGLPLGEDIPSCCCCCCCEA